MACIAWSERIYWAFFGGGVRIGSLRSRLLETNLSVISLGFPSLFPFRFVLLILSRRFLHTSLSLPIIPFGISNCLPTALSFTCLFYCFLCSFLMEKRFPSIFRGIWRRAGGGVQRNKRGRIGVLVVSGFERKGERLI
ncbi:hypothetical protein V8F20_004269 [Naviculisporaceae sp. PSN 640]